MFRKLHSALVSLTSFRSLVPLASFCSLVLGRIAACGGERYDASGTGSGNLKVSPLPFALPGDQVSWSEPPQVASRPRTSERNEI